jgi:hypothetical protein
MIDTINELEKQKNICLTNIRSIFQCTQLSNGEKVIIYDKIINLFGELIEESKDLRRRIR